MANATNEFAAESETFAHLSDLIAERNGGQILFATDDFFAVAENLIKDEEPVWQEGMYTEFGKWMDGWETRRKRRPGHDFCIIRLAAPGTVSGIEINTAYFTGNHAPRASIQAATLAADDAINEFIRTPQLGGEATDEDLQKTGKTEKWEIILPMVGLKSGYAGTCRNVFSITSTKVWTHVRLNMFPDGGIARLRVFGRVRGPAMKLDPGEIVDLVAFANGGECVSFSDAHYGHPRNLIRPGRGVSMADGWETARRVDRPAVLAVKEDGLINYSGHEWCVLKLGIKGKPVKVEIDTNHFKGNFPDVVRVEGGVDHEGNTTWVELLPFRKLRPHQLHSFPVHTSTVVSCVRVTITPDGGISRLRVLGLPGEVVLAGNLDH